MSRAVASPQGLQPSITNVVTSQLQSLMDEVLHTLRRDLVRVGLLTAVGIATRHVAALAGTARWQAVWARLDASVLIGIVALVGGVATAVITQLKCTGGHEAPAYCLLSSGASTVAVDSEPPSWRWGRNLQVVLRPVEAMLLLVALVAIDRTDLTVRLLDGAVYIAKRCVHGLWAILVAVCSSWRGSARGRGRRVFHDSRRRRDVARPRHKRQRRTPLPPAIARTLSRRRRRELEELRAMFGEDPVRALRDCLQAGFGWRACRALMT